MGNADLYHQPFNLYLVAKGKKECREQGNCNIDRVVEGPVCYSMLLHVFVHIMVYYSIS